MGTDLARQVLVLTIVGVLGACGDSTARPGHRDEERRAVMVALLTQAYGQREDEHGNAVKRFVLDPELSVGPRYPSERALSRLRERGREPPDAIVLPNGRRVRAPAIEDLDAELVADWAAHGGPSPTPKNLDLPLPIDWFSREDWEQLKGVVVTGGFGSPKWQAFHVCHPDSAGWISMSSVGLSPNGEQALIYASSSSGSLSGAGLWYLLEKHDGSWAIIKKKVAWIS